MDLEEIQGLLVAQLGKSSYNEMCNGLLKFIDAMPDDALYMFSKGEDPKFIATSSKDVNLSFKTKPKTWGVVNLLEPLE